MNTANESIVFNQMHKFGSTLHEKGVFFRVWAPNAESVFLTGTFNNWDSFNTSMLPEDDGSWGINIDNAKAGDEYKFIIKNGDKTLYRNDPYAREVTNSTGNSIVHNHDFNWEDDEQFQMPNHNDLVIYEIHVGTFNKVDKDKPGSFLTAIKKLDYLKWLGINAIEVMPPFEFAGDLSWGYNPAHPFAIESAYGGPNAFKTFVKECHKRGIAVILDVVYNHFGPSDIDLWQFDGWSENDKGGIYFYNDWRSTTPWGDTRPDYGREEVRRYILQNALMWLTEYRCDGLRMDMIPYIRNVYADGNPDNNLLDGYTLVQEINRTIKHHFPHKITIAEDLHTIQDITLGVNEGGFGYSAQWDAQFVHPVQEVLKAMDDDDRDIFKIEQAIKFRYNDDAFRRVVYTESHDEVANGKARIVEEIAPDKNGKDYFAEKRALLGLAVALTSPGIPMIFQGQPILEDKWFDDTDAVDWSKLQENRGFAQSVRDLIHLRRNLNNLTKGLQSQFIETLYSDNDTKVISYHRFDKTPAGTEGSVVIIANFRNQDYEYYQMHFPYEGNWELVFNSSYEEYSSYNENNSKAANIKALQTPVGIVSDIHLSAYGILIYVQS